MKKNLLKVVAVSVAAMLIVGCSSKKPEEYTLKEIASDLPDWYLQPKDAMGKDYLCEVGSDTTRTGAILEGKENLMALIETEVKYHAQTQRNGHESRWRSKTDFRSEGMLNKAVIQKYKFGPDNRLYVLVCINKNDVEWSSW